MAKTIFLSPSRQTESIGSGEYGSEAKRMNELGNIIEAELERHGVYVEREGNEISVQERIKIANELKADLYISLHSNAVSANKKGTICGTEIYVLPENETAKDIAVNIYSEMKKIQGFKERGIRNNRDFLELNSPNMPSCLIEVDYHDNYDRACWIVENMYSIAIAIVKGILKYFDIKYVARMRQKYYRVQLGAFSNKSMAEKLAMQLCNAGYPATVKYY